MRVVLDSNVLFSALISPHASPHRIYESWRKGRFTLITCSQQLEEIRHASRYPRLRRILQPHHALMGDRPRFVHSARRIRAPYCCCADEIHTAFDQPP